MMTRRFHSHRFSVLCMQMFNFRDCHVTTFRHGTFQGHSLIPTYAHTIWRRATKCGTITSLWEGRFSKYATPTYGPPVEGICSNEFPSSLLNAVFYLTYRLMHAVCRCCIGSCYVSASSGSNSFRPGLPDACRSALSPSAGRITRRWVSIDVIVILIFLFKICKKRTCKG